MLEFRPHHFMCTLGFEGKGYSEAFVKNYQAIADSLRLNPPEGGKTQIRVARNVDSICGPCPHRRGEVCETETKIQKLDQAHAKILDLKPGDVLSWDDAQDRIASRMTLEAFDQACGPCSWKAMGVCETALKKVIAERKSAPREKTP